MKLAWILWLSQLLPQPAADSLCLSTTVYLEARDQTLRGQQAVAEVAAQGALVWVHDYQLQLVPDDVEHAAALQARRSVFILKANGHVDVHLGMFGNAQEVGVQRTVGDGVESHILGQGTDRLAVHLDHEDRIEEVAGAEQLVQRAFFDMDRFRILLVAVNDGGYTAFAAECTLPDP